MTRQQQKVGHDGESLAENVLRSLGVRCLERIGTPVRLIPHPTQSGYYRVIWGEKVAADRRGIMSDGRSVLVEVKTILDRNLSWSDLREHQPGALSEHSENHGLSLLVWVHHSGVYVLEWPVPGFGPHKSIPVDFAKSHDERTKFLIAEYTK